MRASEEATREGLRLAREAGEAYQRSVSHFLEKVAENGATMQVGDYRVGVALEGAEPLWYPQGDGLELAEPPEQANLHLEVVVTDKDDGRFVPELDVAVTLQAEDGRKVGTWDLPFLWHPTMFHYGRNISRSRRSARAGEPRLLEIEQLGEVDTHEAPAANEAGARSDLDAAGRQMQLGGLDAHPGAVVAANEAPQCDAQNSSPPCRDIGATGWPSRGLKAAGEHIDWSASRHLPATQLSS